MIKKLVFTLIASSTLYGCGGDSSGNDSKTAPAAKSFDISAYDAVASYTDTLAGTWVAVSTGWQKISEGEYEVYNNISERRFFVIRENGNSYQSSNCISDGFSNIYGAGDNITIPEIGNLSVESSSSIYGTQALNESAYGVTMTGSTTTQIVKISNSVNSIGTFTSNYIGETNISDVHCVAEGSAGGTDGDVTGTATVFMTNAGDVEFSTESANSNGYSYKEINLDYKEWNTDYGDSVSIYLSHQDDFAFTLNFNASGYSNSISGSLNVQLPRQ